MFSRIIEGKLDLTHSAISPELRDVIGKLTQPARKERWVDMKLVLSHPFFASLDKSPFASLILE